MPRFPRQPALSSLPLEIEAGGGERGSDATAGETKLRVPHHVLVALAASSRHAGATARAAAAAGTAATTTTSAATAAATKTTMPALRRAQRLRRLARRYCERVVRADARLNEALADEHQREAQARMRRKNEHVLGRVRRVQAHRAAALSMLRDSEAALACGDNQRDFEAIVFPPVDAGIGSSFKISGEVVLASCSCTVGSRPALGTLYATFERLAYSSSVVGGNTWVGGMLGLGLLSKTLNISFSDIAAVFKTSGVLMNSISVRTFAKGSGGAVGTVAGGAGGGARARSSGGGGGGEGSSNSSDRGEEHCFSFPVERDRVFEVIEQVITMRRSSLAGGVGGAVRE